MSSICLDFNAEGFLVLMLDVIVIGHCRFTAANGRIKVILETTGLLEDLERYVFDALDGESHCLANLVD